MKILSLFDGMSCGMLAMIAAGVKVEQYDAYEIDKYAVTASKHNFPQIEQHGDVFAADFTAYSGYDFLIGGSPCFTEGHLVLTDAGYKDIAEIKVGDKVLTHKGRYKRVIRANTRQAETVNVKILGYPVFTTTAEHPFYTLTRRKKTYAEYRVSPGSWRNFSDRPAWTAAKDLSVDHFCGQHIMRSSGINEHGIDVELAYILGRYVADGHLRKSKREGRKDSYCYQVILSIGVDKVDRFKKQVTNRHFSCYPHSENVYRCVFSSQKMLDFIRSQGFGENAHEKKIPEFVYNLPRHLQEAFLAGYLDGDGHYVKSSGVWMASTVSPVLAFGLQRLITGLCETNVSVMKQSNDRKDHKIGNREIRANYPIYTVLYKPGYMRKQSAAHIQGGIVWTNVRSVSPTRKTETVYNIEVEDDQSYTVNNCIVHNCTYWSIAQRPDKRETVASGLGWELFSQYVRALHEAQPRMFIYENNKSMSKDIRASITETFGFEPICINSALVSAQNRQRLYWVGIRNEDGTYRKASIEQPADRGILLKDVLDSAQPVTMASGKGYTLTASYGHSNATDLRRRRNSQAAEPVRQLTESEIEYMVRDHGDRRWSHTQRPGEEEKSRCLTANVSKGVPDNVCAEPACVASRGRNPENPSSRIAGDPTEQRFEAHEDGKTNTLTSVSKDNPIAEPVRVECVGVLRNNQGFRIHGIEGKNQALPAQSGGLGGHSGPIAEPTALQEQPYGRSANVDGQYDRRYEAKTDGKAPALTSVESRRIVEVPQNPVRIGTMPRESDGEQTGGQAFRIYDTAGKSVTLKGQAGDGGGKTWLYATREKPTKEQRVYEVKDGMIEVNGKRYPIKLRDGRYVIRKLTVTECMRLQTVPEWYDFSCVSNTQAYKMLGNGWTVEVIAHLIRGAIKSSVFGI